MNKPNSTPPQKKNKRALTIIIAIIIILALLGIYSHYKQKNETSANSMNAPALQDDTSKPDNNSNTDTNSTDTSTNNTSNADTDNTENTNNTNSDADNNSNTDNNPNQTKLPEPKTVSNFTLTDNKGKPFTNENLKGHWTMMFFGFTRCGDVCPLTLSELNKMYGQLQKEVSSDQLPQVVFVSVDPERDNTDTLNRYIDSYNPNFIAATGDKQNLDIFAKELGVYYSKEDKGDGNYSMKHSSQIFLFNPAGDWVGELSYPFQGPQLAQSFKSFQ